MQKGITWIFLLSGLSLLFSCEKEKISRLPSVEERTSEAINTLRSELLDPQDGWRLEYQPTEGSGVFLMFLEFDEDGTVMIESDVADNEGEFFEQTIPWRIDNALGLQLIFETYGVFHYLFEQEGATFGAEYQFVYIGKEDNNLYFRSFSDPASSSTVLIFQPANNSERNQLARETSSNLNKFATISPSALEIPIPKQQIYLEDQDVSIYWSLDPARRIIQSSVAVRGDAYDAANLNPIELNHISGYKLQSSGLELLDPLEFVINNRRFTMNRVNFLEFNTNGPGFCSLNSENGPQYTGQIPGIGPITMTGSLFDFEGTEFQPIEEFPYSVNIFFLFDNTETSLTEEGQIVAEKFPDAVAYLFYYGYDSDSIPSYSAGLLIEDELGKTNFLLQEFDPTQTIGNRITIKLKNAFYNTGMVSDDRLADLSEVNGLLYEGEEMYVSDFPVEGLTVFKLFNPCSRYEVLLVR